MFIFVALYSKNHPLNLYINYKFHYTLNLAILNWILEYSAVECEKVIEPTFLKYFEPMLLFYVVFNILCCF